MTAGHRPRRARAERSRREHDDYNAILAKALADRLAEAFAERLHERVRRELWGYAPDEALDNDALIAEAYQGIRPAPGYAGQPDHTEKRTIFDAARRRARAGITLTEMLRHAARRRRSAGSTSGTREARYFGLGRIGRDQLEDYARRKGWSSTRRGRALAAPNLDDDAQT